MICLHYEPDDDEPVPCRCEEDVQCARCGSSIASEPCECCLATGHWDHPDPDCAACEGTGWVWGCLSGTDWCRVHPNEGREDVEPHTVEVFKIHAPGCSRSGRSES